jgi:hypothetical protein
VRHGPTVIPKLANKEGKVSRHSVSFDGFSPQSAVAPVPEILAKDAVPGARGQRDECHHKFVLSLPSHCFSQKTPSRWALKEFNLLTSHCPYQKRPNNASHNHIPSHCLHQKHLHTARHTTTYLRADCTLGTLTLRPTTTYLRIVFITSLSRGMAEFLSTTYLHITSIKSFTWAYLRIDFHSTHLHAAPKKLIYLHTAHTKGALTMHLATKYPCIASNRSIFILRVS